MLYIHVYLCVCNCVYMYACMAVCMYGYMHVGMPACIYACVSLYMISIHVCIIYNCVFPDT